MAKLVISPVQSKPRKFAKAGRRAGPRAAAFVLNTKSLQHGEITASSAHFSKGCCTAAKKASGKKGCTGPPRPGQVELVMVPRGKAEKAGLRPGPALRLCTGLGEGTLVPVTDPEAARELAKKYQQCVKGKRSATKSCARRIT